MYFGISFRGLRRRELAIVSLVRFHAPSIALLREQAFCGLTAHTRAAVLFVITLPAANGLSFGSN